MELAKNFDMLYYGLERAYDELEEMCMSLGNYNEHDAFFIIGTVIHWAIDCYERIEKAELLDSEDKEKVSALKFANNCLKHDVAFLDFQQKESGATFPQRVDGSGRFWHYVWKDLNYIKSERNKSQQKKYDKVLSGKAIIHTFRDDMKKIKRYYEKMIELNGQMSL